MSLFKTREYWSVDLDVPDAFDGSSLLVYSNGTMQFLFVGSHDGYLRAYAPPSELATYKPGDLVYETLFPSPVLQIGIGRLVSGSPARHLAILHPKSVAVYSIDTSSGDGEHPLNLRHCYQHALDHAAYSLSIGPYGRLLGREFMCVQSLDGQLSFFEQETPGPVNQLQDFLLPTPFLYLPTNDSFVFQDAQQKLICYQYEDLSHAERKSPKSLWTHNLGGLLMDISCTYDSGASLNVLILTEREFYNLSDEGQIQWMMKFDFQPICFHTEMLKVSGRLRSIICSENQLYIYEDTCLKWSAKLDVRPVCVRTVDMTLLHGLIALLTHSGFLQLSYLGTVPNLYLVPSTVEAEINVAEAEAELVRLQSELTDTDLSKADDVLTVKLTVNPKITEEYGAVSVLVTAEVKTITPLNNVQVLFEVEPPLRVTTSNVVFASLVDSETVNVSVFLDTPGVISSLNILSIVSYTAANGSLRVVQVEEQIPWELAFVVCPPTKDSLHKLTITSNKPACAMSDLFSGVEAGNSAVGLKARNSDRVVTVVAAKASQRYRIQGDALEDLNLPLEIVVRNLKRHHRSTQGLSLSFAGPLPLPKFLELVADHFYLITSRRMKMELLAQRTVQYRTIQKKVLASLKDVTPRPTIAVFAVMNDTYALIKESVADLSQLESKLNASRRLLASLARLIVTLVKLMECSPNDIALLEHAFHPFVLDGDDQGWLEWQNAVLGWLLRTSLAKSKKDQQKPTELSLEPLSDLQTLCKQFSVVVERTVKGSSLSERQEFDSKKDKMPTVPSMKDWDKSDVKLLPRGAKMVDFNVPIIPKPEAVSADTKQAPKKEVAVERETTSVELHHHAEESAIIEPQAEPEPESSKTESALHRESEKDTEKIAVEAAKPVIVGSELKAQKQSKVKEDADDDDVIWDIGWDNDLV